MKNKIHKILGVGLTLVIALALVAGFALPASAAVETINEWYKFDYPVEGADGDWFYSPDIDEIREITEAINGDLYVYVYVPIGDATTYHHIFKSEDGGRTWEETKYCDPDDGVEGGRVFDMVCSSIDEDIVYATDGCYVYKTTDGGDEWDFVARDSLETALVGDCGYDICSYSPSWRLITSIDVTYDDDDHPFVYIGTRAHSGENVGAPYFGSYPGDVFYIGEAGYPANWTSLNLCCFHGGGYDALAVGCAPDWADTKLTYVVITTDDDVDVGGAHTWVVYTTGTVCGWYEFAELLWDCKTGNDFESWAASRIGFPDDWEDTESLFVGVTDDDICEGDTPDKDGGDVYMVWQDYAQDMNVEGIVTGCEGVDSVDIISLDVMGDTDEASLIAGSFCCAHVYYSYDGGWEWGESEKDPTGAMLTYAIWYEDTALAVTSGCEAAVSMSCVSDDVEDVGEAWNQISLIATDIEEVRWIDHSPGYVCEDSETMFMLTNWDPESCCFPCQEECYDYTQSLFRYDGTYWERVYCSVIAGSDIGNDDARFLWVEVSPDFNTTNAVYLANRRFEMWRTLDAGCSWDKLTFPCSPREEIGVIVVIDEDTVIAGGRHPDHGWVFKTTRHGARPWDDYEVTDAADAKSFDLEPGYEDPGSILLGTEQNQVFISEDGGEEWELVGDCETVLTGNDTFVVFDPGYATNNTIYAAAGTVIARCIIDTGEDWADQEWEEICSNGDATYLGIAAAGDTALYVTDSDEVDTVTVSNVVYYTDGGVLRSLNPDAEDAEDVVFERVAEGLVVETMTVDGTELGARPGRLWLTCDTSDEGCAENILWSLDFEDEENVWVYEDTLAAPVVLAMPLDGQKLTKTDEATLSWNTLCDADCYEVSLWRYCAECPEDKLEIDLCLESPCNPGETVVCGPETPDCDINGLYCCPCTEDDCIVVVGLESGTTYYWQVRVCQGQPYLSKWSEERTFITALVAVPFAELCSPPCGDQDIILTPNFSWEAVDGATGYDIELATTETFTAGVIRGSSTVNAWVLTDPLEYATTYYWRVRAEKDGVFSAWTICMFTTMAKPVAPTPPVTITPAPPAPTINIPPAQMITPSWIYAIIAIGAALCVVVIVLIVRTRRPPA